MMKWTGASIMGGRGTYWGTGAGALTRRNRSAHHHRLQEPDLRLLKPPALFPNMTGRDVALRMHIAGPFATADYRYALASPHIGGSAKVESYTWRS